MTHETFARGTSGIPGETGSGGIPLEAVPSVNRKSIKDDINLAIMFCGDTGCTTTGSKRPEAPDRKRLTGSAKTNIVVRTRLTESNVQPESAPKCVTDPDADMREDSFFLPSLPVHADSVEDIPSYHTSTVHLEQSPTKKLKARDLRLRLTSDESQPEKQYDHSSDPSPTSHRLRKWAAPKTMRPLELLIGAFLVRFCAAILSRCFGVVVVALHAGWHLQRLPWIFASGSVGMCVFCLVPLVTSVTVWRRLSSAQIVFGASTLAATGLIVAPQVGPTPMLTMTLGVLLGGGLGLSLEASLHSLDAWEESGSLVDGVASLGSVVGGVVLPPVLHHVFMGFSFGGSFLIIGAFMLNLWPASLLIGMSSSRTNGRAKQKQQQQQKYKEQTQENSIKSEICEILFFLLPSIAVSLNSAAFFSSFCLIPAWATNRPSGSRRTWIFISIINFCDLIGRLGVSLLKRRDSEVSTAPLVFLALLSFASSGVCLLFTFGPSLSSPEDLVPGAGLSSALTLPFLPFLASILQGVFFGGYSLLSERILEHVASKTCYSKAKMRMKLVSVLGHCLVTVRFTTFDSFSNCFYFNFFLHLISTLFLLLAAVTEIFLRPNIT